MDMDPLGIVFWFECDNTDSIRVRPNAWDGCFPHVGDIFDLNNLTVNSDEDTVFEPGQLHRGARLERLERVSRRWVVTKRSFGLHNTRVFHLCPTRA